MNPSFDWQKTSQLSLVQLLLAVFLPSAFAFTGFHFVLPALVAGGMPPIVAWPVVASLMLLVLVGLGVFFLRREASELNISLWQRLCFKSLSLKQWGLYLLIIIAGLAVSLAVQGLVVPFMNLTGLTVPAYMPFFLNPTINPATAEMSVVSPGLPLLGAYWLLPLIAVTLLLNILAEELYFRAWMLPKLSSWGHWGWIANGVLFACYHTFQIWLLPVLVVASLFFAFVIYHSQSLWPSLVAHLVANFLLSILGILLLVMGLAQ